MSHTTSAYRSDARRSILYSRFDSKGKKKVKQETNHERQLQFAHSRNTNASKVRMRARYFSELLDNALMFMMQPRIPIDLLVTPYRKLTFK